MLERKLEDGYIVQNWRSRKGCMEELEIDESSYIFSQ